MYTLSKVRPLVARLGLLAVLLLLSVALPHPAMAQDEPAETAEEEAEREAEQEAAEEEAVAGDPACAATGYVVDSPDGLADLRTALRNETVHELDGVSLDRVDTWVLPDGATPVVVIDSTEPLPGGEVSAAVAGTTFPVRSDTFHQDAEQRRYVPNVSTPQLGSVVRTMGLEVEGGPCAVAVVLSVDRSLLSTVAGGTAVALTALFGLLTVLVARLRKGGWLRRFLSAAPLGLLAGSAQAVVLLEAGVISPFASFPWWLPVAGVVLAALLPLTRWRRRRAAPAAGGPAWSPPGHAPLGGYQPVAGFTRTAVGEVHRAVDAAGARRALVKVAPAERAGEPAARLGLEREAQVLSGVDHPNLVRLLETLPGAGAPTLVFEDVDGAPLRQVAGRLSGPQAVTVVLGVLAGLGVVHARGLVHRDVSPQTVWLSGDGRVLLAGFELACPGMEHPVAPESGSYPSPEQRGGQVLDGRSDLYSCAAMLRELSDEPVPAPVAGLLGRALADDPAGRPPSAEQFAADLRQAAYQGYGPDWAGRGVLAGALAAHGAIGAAAGGYGLAGAAGSAAGGTATGGAAAGGTATGGAAAGGAGAGLGAAGQPVGAAAGGAAGLGAAGQPVGMASAGAAGQSVGMASAGAAGHPVGVAGAGAAASSGKIGALVNAGVAVAVGAAIGVAAIVVDPQPAQAQTEVITPEQAQVIFVRTVDEARAGTTRHLAEPAQDAFATMLELDDEIAGARLTEVAVGVPPDQHGYPAWFVGSAEIPYQDGRVWLYARFERESAEQPWQMTMFNWSDEHVLAAPLREAGWLAPVPDVADLLVEPESLPERYRDWLVRANEAVEVGTDEVLTLRYDGGMIDRFAREIPFFSGGDPEFFSYDYSMNTGEVTADLVPLVDGTVHVVFTSIISQTSYNRPDGRSGSCDNVIIDGDPYRVTLSWENNDPPGEFRESSQDYVVSVEAWVPVRGETAEEVDPDRVVIEDWNYETTNRTGEPC